MQQIETGVESVNNPNVVKLQREGKCLKTDACTNNSSDGKSGTCTDIATTTTTKNNNDKNHAPKTIITPIQNKEMSSSINSKYGPIRNDESDDEGDKKEESTNQKDSQNGEKRDEKMTEAELAAQSRGNKSIKRATDEVDDEDDASSAPSDAAVTIGANGANTGDGEDGNDDNDDSDKESLSQEAYYDAVEFESLLFSVRRTTARFRLLKLISCLKQLSAKLERSDEVKKILQQISPQLQQQPKPKMSGNKRKIADIENNGTNGSTTMTSKKRAHNDISPTSTTEKSITVNGTTVAENAILRATATENNKNNAITTTNANANTTNTSKITICPTCPNPRSQPPTLKQKSEWVQLHSKGLGLHCPDFSVDNTCPLASSCPRHHVYKPMKPNKLPLTKELTSRRKLKTATKEELSAWFSKADMEKVYEEYRNITLTKECFSDKIKPDELNIAYYTCYFKCPVDNIVYFAQPFPGDTFVNGNKSSQGIWWYMNMKDAREALATHVIRHLQSRNIVPDVFKPNLINEEEILQMKRNASAKAATALTNSLTEPSSHLTPTLLKKTSVLPSVLPELKPWNWAEISYERRCEHFNQPQGCSSGILCHHAHVHFPTTVTTDRYPPKGALPLAYLQHFQIEIKDPFFQTAKQQKKYDRKLNLFHVKTLIDNRNQIWYTAAFTCPCEKTIFYAAGGTGGRQNPQGFVLYPSVEEAKLAVAGIVLNSFLARGFDGEWSKGYKKAVV